MIKKIISGGQTGVDRAALDVAIDLHISYGGWCPKGRLAELSGTIPEKYLLQETQSAHYSERTKLNIRDSDATLILVPEIPFNFSDGTLLTISEVKGQNKSYLIFDLSKEWDIGMITQWIKGHQIKVLNIAGPRESQSPGIYSLTYQLLTWVFQIL